MRGIVYAQVDGFRPLTLDLSVPPGATTLCVYLHGGGWRVGSRRAEPAPGFFDLLTSMGVGVAGVDYRLSGEAVYPAQQSDVAAALDWLSKFEHGCTRTVLWGASAGAQLAAIAALTQPVPIAKAVCWYPPTDFDALSKDIAAVGGVGDRSASSREGQLIGAALDDRPDLALAASPISHVRAGAPPFLFVHGTADINVPARQSERLAEALRAAGGSAEVDLIPGAGHTFPELDADTMRSVMRRSAEFLLSA
jgi:acetyl esterase/lipase